MSRALNACEHPYAPIDAVWYGGKGLSSLRQALPLNYFEDLGQVAYLSEPWPLILNLTEFEWQ